MKIYEIVPIQGTYFWKTELPDKVTLSPEMVRANYQRRSPFGTGVLLSVQVKNRLSIWFVREPLAEERRIYIPEGYLVFQAHRTGGSAIMVYSVGTAKVYLVEKAGELVAQVSFPGPLDAGTEEQTLQLLAREHSLSEPQICRIERDFTPGVGLSDLRAFWRFDYSAEKALLWLLQASKLPLILFLLTLSAYQLSNVNYLEGLIETRGQELLALKQQNSDVKGKIQAVETEVDFWRRFELEVSRRPDFRRLLEAVSSQVAADKGYLTNLIFSGDELKLWIGLTTPAADLVERFVQTGLFAEVKVISSTRSGREAETDIVQIALTLAEPAASEPQAGVR